MMARRFSRNHDAQPHGWASSSALEEHLLLPAILLLEATKYPNASHLICAGSAIHTAS
jgi:hypothetical protein